MRGKLRDKRTDTKRDYFKREVIERKRTSKRSMVAWLDQQQLDEGEDLLDIEDDNDDEMEVEIPKQQQTKK